MIPQTLIECFVYSTDICILFISCSPHSLEMRIFGSLNVIPNFRIVPYQQVLFCLQTSARQPPRSHFTSVVKPEVTQYHQEHLKACCAIEVSLNRLTFAKLRLDSTGSNRVLLEVWDSVPLKLPGGKEFRPQLCESVARAALVHLDQNGVTPAYCETAGLLFRPVSFGQTPKPRTTVADTIGYSHHALVLGFLCASLLPSSNPNTFAFPYIDENSLSSWVGYRAEDWPRVVQEALQNYPDAYVRLTPLVKRSTPVRNHTEDILNVNLHFKSDTIMSTFDSRSTQYRDRVAIQFLLSRCLFSCLHYFFGRDYL
ncbi:hypothetical protein CRM22_003582 [Opisthorchis felineus]|uniref:Uncharacterized protein n=1 Tax=Opisthorchis felineus TaxID=147828 RepID=A0A4S2M0I5_OPIFE|nr:hypothetical protein CRM22_003582 [Opisthorchis felineus]